MSNRGKNAADKRYGDFTPIDLDAEIATLRGFVADIDNQAASMRSLRLRDAEIDGATAFERIKKALQKHVKAIDVAISEAKHDPSRRLPDDQPSVPPVASPA